MAPPPLPAACCFSLPPIALWFWSFLSLGLEHLRRRMRWVLLPCLQLVAFLFVLASFLVSSFLLLRGVSFSLQPPWPSFRPLPCEVFPPLPSFVDLISFLVQP